MTVSDQSESALRLGRSDNPDKWNPSKLEVEISDKAVEAAGAAIAAAWFDAAQHYHGDEERVARALARAALEAAANVKAAFDEAQQ